MPSPSRRRFLGQLLALGGALGLPRITLAAATPEDDFDYLLTAEAADVELVPGTTSPGLTFSGEAPGPLLHARQGRRLRVKLVNRLDLPTTIHWHGIRIDNAMDGVPWITQRPVMPGETFVYDFVPPDAGTFWYHPHIYSIEELSRGMVGMLIVAEREPPDFDADIPLGPGMRLDMGLLTPARDGVEIPVHHLQGRRRELLLTLRTEGPSQSRAGPPVPLPANPLGAPDLTNAEVKRFTFDWSGVIAPDEEEHPSFWAINKKPWPGAGDRDIPPPIAVLEHGRSYIFGLKNTSQYAHPIHLHGMIFTVLATDKRDIDPHQADTVMLDAYETVRVALVADNPGKWMYHCHVIEHMKTGLMAYIEVV